MMLISTATCPIELRTACLDILMADGGLEIVVADLRDVRPGVQDWPTELSRHTPKL
jgi:hypothetical protein